MRKGAAHGFRNLSVNKIPNTFERLITNLQTNIDIFMNGFAHGVLSQKVSSIFVKKPVPLTIVSGRKL
jgi:hypothetical protein